MSKKIKKIILNFIILNLLPLIFVFIFILSFIGGGTTSTTVAIEPPVSEHKAEEYGYIASELGVPFSLILITDYIFASIEGKKSIEDNNPLLTALEFMLIQEQIENYKLVGSDDAGNPIYKWIIEETNFYIGKQEILSYLNIKTNIDSLTPADIISTLNIKDEELDKENKRYILTLESNNNFEFVLKDIIGFDEESIEKILDLYESKYIEMLYFGDMMKYIGSYNLPDIVIGNVTRLELIQIAGSIINHPYGWGGKSNHTGIPTVPLDCSGYIDWVFYQAFGKTVNGGTIPSGVGIYGTSIQYYSSQPINENELQIGDLGFYYHPSELGNKINHVGIYIGNGQFIHAGGQYFGTNILKTGRVGISNNDNKTINNINSINHISMVEPMKAANFKVFARPRFLYIDE